MEKAPKIYERSLEKKAECKAREEYVNKLKENILNDAKNVKNTNNASKDATDAATRANTFVVGGDHLI